MCWLQNRRYFLYVFSTIASKKVQFSITFSCKLATANIPRFVSPCATTELQSDLLEIRHAKKCR